MKLKIKKLHPAAIVPKFATEGAACFDLHAIECGHQDPIYARGSRLFRTGLAFEVPTGHAMMVYSRSGHGFKNGVRLVNCVGVIDSDYRGEVMVKLHADDTASDVLRVNPGDRIAQAMIVELPHVQFEVVDELSRTVRGDGGFGSTGSGFVA